jgi:hypothetical protein
MDDFENERIVRLRSRPRFEKARSVDELVLEMERLVDEVRAAAFKPSRSSAWGYDLVRNAGTIDRDSHLRSLRIREIIQEAATGVRRT